jgi:hypothetical protein
MTRSRGLLTMMEKETPKLCANPQSRFNSCLYPNCAKRSSSPSSPLFDGRRSTARSCDAIVMKLRRFNAREKVVLFVIRWRTSTKFTEARTKEVGGCLTIRHSFPTNGLPGSGCKSMHHGCLAEIRKRNVTCQVWSCPCQFRSDRFAQLRGAFDFAPTTPS